MERLLSLHPQTAAPTLPPSPVPAPISFTTKVVLKAIMSFPATSAAGPSGLKATHLKEAVCCTSPTSAERALNAWTNLANLFVGGHAPMEIYSMLCGANLFALNKKSGGIRPIAVGEVFRRLVAKCASAVTRSMANSYLVPLQLGVATRGGCEAIVHSANQLLQEFPDIWTLSIDFENAFNTINRTKMLQAVRNHLPQLSAIAEACYGSTAPLLHFNGESIASCTGVQQGDPLGPLFFAITLQPVLQRIKDEVPNLKMNAWYLDDGFIAGDLQSVSMALQILEEESPLIGLRLCKDKCRITRPQVSQVAYQHVNGISISPTRDLTLLGAPVGSPQFKKNHLHGKVNALRDLMNKLPSLDDPQLQLTMLRACFGLPKFYFSVRTTAPEYSLGACEEFDGHQRSAPSTLLGAPINDRTWRQSSLPISLGGLGLRSAAQHASSAYFCSLSLSAPLSRLIISSISMPDASLVETGLSQKELSWQVDYASYGHLLETATDNRARARLRSVALPHAGDFLTVVPSTSLGLAIPSAEFTMCVKYRLGIPIFSASSSCPACGRMNDVFGDHAIGCGGDHARIGRHDRLRDILFTAASAAALGPRREVQLSGTSNSRPADVYLPSWRKGQPAALDVTVISSLQTSTVSQGAQTSGHALQVAKQRKMRAHYEECHQAGVNFVPLSVEVLGGWEEEALSHIKEMSRMLDCRLGPNRETSKGRHLLQRLSVELQRGNGNLLLLRNRSLPPDVDGVF